MVSAINPSLPADGVQAVKAQLRANLAAAKSEIEALQAFNATLPTSLVPGRRNRIINGDMGFNQRSGTGVPKSSGISIAAFGPDRWYLGQGLAGGLISETSLQTSPPTGFRNYVRLQTTTLKSLVAADVHAYSQAIEGVHVQDFAWGTANAKPIAISFWVRGSIAGGYAVCLASYAGGVSYIANYTITTANTWEYKTILVPGPLIGTFTNYTDTYLAIKFDLGSGSSFRTSQNIWQSGTYYSFTGAVSLVSTLNATLDITGVVLEPGTIANGWENYILELEAISCQRYCQSISASCRQYATVVGAIANNTMYYLTSMRAVPTATVVNVGGFVNVSAALLSISTVSARFEITASGVGDCYNNDRVFLLESEIT